MNVVIAENYGFCFGVKRAMEQVEQALQESPTEVYALGELIHNPHVIEKLEQKGLRTIESVTEITQKNARLIVRSHGVGKYIYDYADNQGIIILDTTCPFVRKIQRLVENAQKEQRHIVIVGDPLHPEIIGINGWCENKGEVLQDLPQALSWQKKDARPVSVVAQTTMNPERFLEIVQVIQKKADLSKVSLTIHNTICMATKDRQSAGLKLSKECDAMVVIGGKESSNSKKLAAICEKTVPVYFVQDLEELTHHSLQGIQTIGVTAGASTPDFIIQAIISYLQGYPS